jgi:hypothetical protein
MEAKVRSLVILAQAPFSQGGYVADSLNFRGFDKFLVLADSFNPNKKGGPLLPPFLLLQNLIVRSGRAPLSGRFALQQSLILRADKK